MDAIERRIVNALQGDFPLTERPYAAVAHAIGLEEDDLIARLGGLLSSGVLSRFGPMYDAEQLGGGVLLAAMAVPAEHFETVAQAVNAHPEVAHNYERDHDLNMWFVVASDRRPRLAEVIAEIEAETGLEVYAMPKLEEFFLGLRLEA